MTLLGSKELESEKKAKKQLAAKIAAMEGKLLVGGKTIHDRTSEHERELERRRIEASREREREREMQQKLKEEEERRLEKMVRGNTHTFARGVYSIHLPIS